MSGPLLQRVVLVYFAQSQWADADARACRVWKHVFGRIFRARARIGTLDLEVLRLSDVVVVVVHHRTATVVQLVQHGRQSFPLVLLLLRAEQIVVSCCGQVVVVLVAIV